MVITTGYKLPCFTNNCVSHDVNFGPVSYMWILRCKHLKQILITSLKNIIFSSFKKEFVSTFHSDYNDASSLYSHTKLFQRGAKFNYTGIINTGHIRICEEPDVNKYNEHAITLLKNNIFSSFKKEFVSTFHRDYNDASSLYSHSKLFQRRAKFNYAGIINTGHKKSHSLESSLFVFLPTFLSRFITVTTIINIY